MWRHCIVPYIIFRVERMQNKHVKGAKKQKNHSRDNLILQTRQE